MVCALAERSFSCKLTSKVAKIALESLDGV
jgi:hypothetical protein